MDNCGICDFIKTELVRCFRDGDMIIYSEDHKMIFSLSNNTVFIHYTPVPKDIGEVFMMDLPSEYDHLDGPLSDGFSVDVPFDHLVELIAHRRRLSDLVNDCTEVDHSSVDFDDCQYRGLNSFGIRIRCVLFDIDYTQLG